MLFYNLYYSISYFMFLSPQIFRYVMYESFKIWKFNDPIVIPSMNTYPVKSIECFLCFGICKYHIRVF